MVEVITWAGHQLESERKAKREVDIELADFKQKFVEVMLRLAESDS